MTQKTVQVQLEDMIVRAIPGFVLDEDTESMVKLFRLWLTSPACKSWEGYRGQIEYEGGFRDTGKLRETIQYFFPQGNHSLIPLIEKLNGLDVSDPSRLLLHYARNPSLFCCGLWTDFYIRRCPIDEVKIENTLRSTESIVDFYLSAD